MAECEEAMWKEARKGLQALNGDEVLAAMVRAADGSITSDIVLVAMGMVTAKFEGDLSKIASLVGTNFPQLMADALNEILKGVPV